MRKIRSVCGTSQFAGSSGPVPYTSRVFNRVKWVFRLSLSLPQKIVMIAAFMHCKVVVRIKVAGLGLVSLSVVGLGLACGLVLRLRLVSGLNKWLFYIATVRQLNHVVISVIIWNLEDHPCAPPPPLIKFLDPPM